MRRPAFNNRTVVLMSVAMGLALGATFVADGLPQLQEGRFTLVAFCEMALALLLAALASRPSTLSLQPIRVAIQNSKRHSVIEVNVKTGALYVAARSAREAEAELETSYFQFVEVMARALDARDPYTAGHSIRVGAFARAIAIEMGLSEPEAETVRIAAEMHDIGKIGIPDAILQKPGQLTQEEYGLIKLHPQIGRKILEKSGPFAKLLAAVELHHENHDGSGYPYGLAGEAIPLEARIVHVADAFDAMVTHRSFRKARPVAEALEELRRNAGTQFDPAVIEAFLRRLRKGGPETIVLSSGLTAEILLPGITIAAR